MEKDELNRQIASIKAECESKIADVRMKYAKENQMFKIGDVVAQNKCVIEIEKIKYSLYSDPPEAVYFGVWLKVNGEPNKKNEIAVIYQSNII